MSESTTPQTTFAPAPGYRTDSVAVEVKQAEDGTQARLAGRVVLWRKLGGLVFGHILDRSGRVQISLRRDDLGTEQFNDWSRSVKVGDFVGVSGRKYITNKGEPTLAVTDLTVLNQARRQLPDKWAGITHAEVRYRRRYLDLISDSVSRDRFRTRSRAISAIRRYLDGLDFMEVETPILQEAASGAAARPFITHHNTLDQELYLRIAPETFLKRVVGGGLERVYEMGKLFRNEGSDPSHLQEFTSLEWYAGYWDYRDNMRVVRDLILHVMEETLGTTVVTYQGTELDFGADWPEIDYREAVHARTGIDLTEVRDLPALRDRVKIAYPDSDIAEAPSYAAMVDLLYKRTVRPGLIQPCFLLHHPVELAPLARRSDDDPTRLDMFQVVVHSWEIAKAYSELVDPVDQRERLMEQMAMRDAGDDETMMLEEDFLEAMEYGMPPMSGLGLGIDRLIALLTDAPNLRDVVLFPAMRRDLG
ncbi:lysine--tRNA ligase [Streptomyces lomondensis]|uniref:Lysine--tRNA ligase n=1 Tax=Streptomyces lomondensis TaxID=68229 RepID=A0ABQ2XFK1_9ACTN|nr:lysine--tRNA ligase [Streptomyces lomondensis]MCF0077616.1 lysine--tRNA ligase [Streptomyces lomondensis]GGX13882.1 lysine--tRNA ligase [Streptomyces lomondensis]